MEFALPSAWHRRADETAAAYIALRTFLDLGPGRTVNAAYRAWRKAKYGQSDEELRGVRAPQYWYRWAEKHSWTERADAYDAHVQSEVIAANVDVIADARRQSDQTSILLQSKIADDILAFPGIPRVPAQDAAGQPVFGPDGQPVMIPAAIPLDEYEQRARTLYRYAAAWRYATMTRLMALGAPREETEPDEVMVGGNRTVSLRIAWDDYHSAIDVDAVEAVDDPEEEGDESA